MVKSSINSAPTTERIVEPNAKVNRNWSMWFRDLRDLVLSNTVRILALESTPVPTPEIPEHNELDGLQGGSTNERNHLTDAEKVIAITPAPAIPDHNDLDGLQGGVSGEYNHVTDDQLAKIDAGGGDSESGSYTPVITNKWMVSSVNISETFYTRNGDDVTVFGSANISNPGAAAMSFEMSLPSFVAENFTVSSQGVGVLTYNSALITASAKVGSNTMYFFGILSSGLSHFKFTFRVL